MREKSSIDHLILNVFLKNVHPDSMIPRYIWSHISQQPRNKCLGQTITSRRNRF